MENNKNTVRLININSNPKFKILQAPQLSNQRCDMYVEYINVPQTYYNIYESIDISFTTVAGPTFIISFDIGQWTASDFLTSLTTQMTTLDAPSTYTYTIINGIGQINNAIPGAWGLTIPAIISKYLGLCYQQLSLPASSQSIQLGIIDFTRTRSFIIKCSQSIVGKNSYFLSTDSDNQTIESESKIIAIVPTSASYLGRYSLFVNVGILQNALDFELLDEELVQIDTNCHKWTISLAFCF